MALARVQDFEFEYDNAEEFRLLKTEIFTKHQYYVELETAKPRIIDAGAHIGLATGYFLWLYPLAEVIALEANPRLIPILNRNVTRNQWSGVQVEEGALADKRGTIPFYFDKSPDKWYSVGGIHDGAWNGKQKSWKIEVKCRPLAEYLGAPVDLLKMDIEGAELKVLQAVGERLRVIKHLIMEYHPVAGNALNEVKQTLTRQGFTFEVKKGRNKDEGLLMLEAKQME
jgi:FkbM family methyltransferase